MIASKGLNDKKRHPLITIQLQSEQMQEKTIKKMHFQ
jgi:hypothetical protein